MEFEEFMDLDELIEYRKIGTLEECRAAVEKQAPIKPREIDMEYNYFVCDRCGEVIYLSDEFKSHIYCLNCGQKLDWSDWSDEDV